MAKFAVLVRKKVVRNTDPLRRCYNGCHFSSVEEWSEWKEICQYSTMAIAMDSMATFKSINPKSEYKIQKKEEWTWERH